MTPNTPAKEIKHAGYFFSNTLRKSTDKGTGKRSFIFDSTPMWVVQPDLLRDLCHLHKINK